MPVRVNEIGLTTGVGRRSLDAHGTAAVQLLAGFGWQIPEEDAQFARSHGTAMDYGDFAMQRIWQTRRGIRVLPTGQSSPERVSLILVVAGTAHGQLNGHDIALEVGEALLVRSSSVVTLRTSPAFATVEIATGYDHLSLHEVRADSLDQVLHAQDGSARVFASLVNAVLNSELSAGSPGIGSIRFAVEAAAAALISDAAGRVGLVLGGAGSALLADAYSRIARRSSDPTFDVDALARETGVSRQHLYRLFSRTHTTPAAVIQVQRAQVARTLLVRAASFSLAEQTKVAHLAGFGSVRSMRRALTAVYPDWTGLRVFAPTRL